MKNIKFYVKRFYTLKAMPGKLQYIRKTGSITFNGKLSEIEQKMSDGKIPFLRVHQSYLVNYYLIRSRTKIEITLVNGKKLPISEERQKYFNQQYSHLLGGEINV